MNKTFDRSLTFLVAANLVPLFGVLFFGWSLASVMFLYWLESLVIGLFNAAKMMLVAGWQSQGRLGVSLVAIPLIGFFAVHYGMFMFGHLTFILALFGRPGTALGIVGAFGSLVVSHGVSFAQNFLRQEEYKKTDVGKQMMAPYGRIIVMHLAILFGGFLVMTLNSGILALCLLIAGKISIDIAAHRRQHGRISSLPIYVPQAPAQKNGILS